MKANYGFTCKMTAKPGMGDQLVKLLMTGLDEGNPGSTEWCVVYLVSRSASNPDIVTVQEGWTTEEDHHRIFGGAAAQAIVAQFADILADEPTYDDLIAVDGKANYLAKPWVTWFSSGTSPPLRTQRARRLAHYGPT